MSSSSEIKIKEEMLTEFERQVDEIFNNFNEKRFDQEHLYNSLNWLKQMWNYSRIDIKNKGIESNNIRFFERDIKYDKSLSIEQPDWYKDEKGIGKKIEFSVYNKYLHFQCINDGTLEISVRGLDYRNYENERKHVYINCTKFLLNSKECIVKDTLISHDTPYVFTKRSHNLERINIEIESKTIYYYYPDLYNLFVKSDANELKRDYSNFKEYVKVERSKNNDEKIDFIVNTDEKEQKKTNVAIFGSCVSVDPFRTCYNNYKKDFNKKYEHQRSTIISLMNPKIDFVEEDIKYLKNVPDKLFIDSDIRRDFNKEIFNHLDDIDYLVINVVHDVRWGVLSYEDTYITYSEYIPETNFYKNNKDKLRPITIFNNEKEYFELWTENCDKFFRYLSEQHPNIKVILQKIQLVDYYLTFDGKYEFKQSFHDQAVKLNSYFMKLEQYIQDNYDVKTISFPSDTAADEGNIWGLYTTHYTRSYYEHVFNEIKIHVLEDLLENRE